LLPSLVIDMQPNDLILAKEYTLCGKLKLTLGSLVNIGDMFSNGEQWATLVFLDDGSEHHIENCTVIMRPFAA
jgi:hypothetical protein